MKLQSVTIASNDGEQAPRRVKLFINRSALLATRIRRRSRLSLLLRLHSPEPMFTAAGTALGCKHLQCDVQGVARLLGGSRLCVDAGV